MLDQVRKTITQHIARNIDNSLPVNLDTLALAIATDKGDISGSDAEFHRYCTLRVVKEVAKGCIAKFTTAKPKSGQMSFDGFEHLMSAYSVNRGGVNYLLPVQMMTHAERRIRANEYLKMGDTCKSHGNELLRYNTLVAANDNIPAAQQVAV